MKKNVGTAPALYPMPLAVIGAMNGEKPTWTLVAHMGIIGHDRILVSLAAPHFINGCIKKEGKLSVNLVDERMLPEADEAGAVSGNKEDKSALFAWERGEHGAPVIGKRRSPSNARWRTYTRRRALKVLSARSTGRMWTKSISTRRARSITTRSNRYCSSFPPIPI